jgi:HK97 family phage prohead protease
MMPEQRNEKELRFGEIELRESDEGKLIVEGYAAVYEKETFIGGNGWGFYEVIAKGAFDGADLRDVCFKYNHSDGFAILARTRNKSLVLTPDEKGLHFRAELLDTTDGIDMYKRIKSGLIDKMSFAFTVKTEEITDKDKPNPRRRITKFDKIFDVSAVDTPAYEDTTIYARSREHLEKCLQPLENEERAALDLAKARNKNIFI